MVFKIGHDIWSFHNAGDWIIVPTNGEYMRNTEAVMGAGLALQAKNRFPTLPFELGKNLKKYGNRPFFFKDYRLITFPTKNKWREKSDVRLIQHSAVELRTMIYRHTFLHDIPIYTPKLGCGNGGLQWHIVQPILEKCGLGDCLVVVDYK